MKSAKEKLKNWKLSDKQIEEILTSGKTQDEFPVQADAIYVQHCPMADNNKGAL